MSIDAVLRALGQVAQCLPGQRQQIPLSAAITTVEGAVRGRPITDLATPLDEHLRERGMLRFEYEIVDTFGAGGRYALALFATEEHTEAGWHAAHGQFKRLDDRMAGIAASSPDGVRARLGFDGRGRQDWVRTLFHLAWNFPTYMQGGAGRYRWFRGEVAGWMAPEFYLQTRPLPPAADPYPGLMFSVLPAALDVVTATERAVELFQAALASIGPRPPQAGLPELACELHAAFRSESAFVAPDGAPVAEMLDVLAVRLDSVFDAPRPATGWTKFSRASAKYPVGCRRATRSRNGASSAGGGPDG